MPGAQNNADSLSQNYTVGTSNINLRGLGVSSTLVLLNGRRQAVSALPTIDGSSFVDLSALVPMIALEQVEILEDGAAAVYGSDAIAGVANFVTRSDFQGFEVSVGHRERTNDGSQSDDRVEFVYGRDFLESGNLLLALSYLDRTQLVMGEVDWRTPSWSGCGQPRQLCRADRYDVGRQHTNLCRGDDDSCSLTVPSMFLLPATSRHQPLTTSPRHTVFAVSTLVRRLRSVPEEERLQVFAQLGFDLGEQTRLTAELGYTHNNIRRTISPSLPAIQPRVGLYSSRASRQPVPKQQRVSRWRCATSAASTASMNRSETNYFDSETRRMALIAEGDVTDHLSWEMSFLHARSNIDWRVPDTLYRHLQNAMGIPENDLQDAIAMDANLNDIGSARCWPGLS